MGFQIYPLSAQPNTRVLRMRAIPEQWRTSTRYLPEFGLLRSWCDDLPKPESRRINWIAASGLGASIALSAALWAGVGLLIAHLVR